MKPNLFYIQTSTYTMPSFKKIFKYVKQSVFRRKRLAAISTDSDHMDEELVTMATTVYDESTDEQSFPEDDQTQREEDQSAEKTSEASSSSVTAKTSKDSGKDSESLDISSFVEDLVPPKMPPKKSPQPYSSTVFMRMPLFEEPSKKPKDTVDEGGEKKEEEVAEEFDADLTMESGRFCRTYDVKPSANKPPPVKYKRRTPKIFQKSIRTASAAVTNPVCSFYEDVAGSVMAPVCGGKPPDIAAEGPVSAPAVADSSALFPFLACLTSINEGERGTLGGHCDSCECSLGRKGGGVDCPRPQCNQVLEKRLVMNRKGPKSAPSTPRGGRFNRLNASYDPNRSRDEIEALWTGKKVPKSPRPAMLFAERDEEAKRSQTLKTADMYLKDIGLLDEKAMRAPTNNLPMSRQSQKVSVHEHLRATITDAVVQVHEQLSDTT